MKLRKLKEKFDRFRPDKNKVIVGDGELEWKIKAKKVQFKIKKKFENEVEISIMLKATGDVYKFRKPEGYEAKFEAVKRF